MRYCSHCGSEVNDDAVVCIHCGCQLNDKKSGKSNVLAIVAKVFMILTCVACVIGKITILALAWCIPMTVSVFRRTKNNEHIGTGFKICTLIFVNIVSGICLLCMDD